MLVFPKNAEENASIIEKGLITCPNDVNNFVQRTVVVYERDVERRTCKRHDRLTIPFWFTKRLKIDRDRLSRKTNWPGLCCFFFLPSHIFPEIISFNDVTTKLTSSAFLSFLLANFN